MALLVEQSLLYISGNEVSDDALSKAKYRRQTPTFREPFYLRQYGGSSFLDQIVVEFSPKDDLFGRRSALTMSVRGITEHDVRTKVTANLSKNGYHPRSTRNTGYTEYSDGTTEIEAFIYVQGDDVSISIRRN